MIEEKLKKIISLNGLSITIGILGSLASILTVFVTQWDSKISLRWFVFTLFIAVTVILILIKLLYELNNDLKTISPNSSSVVRYVTDSMTFLVRKNNFLGHAAMVSIFYLDDSYEIELGKGYVKNIQENFIQIKILDVSNDFKANYKNILDRIESNDIITLQKIVVKNYITYSK